MTEFLLTHQPLIIALAWISGALLVALVIGVGYRPRVEGQNVVRGF